jgi:hypothetical protein
MEPQPQKPGGAENRLFRRANASFSVTFIVKEPFAARLEFGDKEREGIADDLSIGGLSLVSDYQLLTHFIVRLKFRLVLKDAPVMDATSRKFELQGEVCYSVTAPDKSFRMGIRFLNATKADRDFISGCL